MPSTVRSRSESRRLGAAALPTRRHTLGGIGALTAIGTFGLRPRRAFAAEASIRLGITGGTQGLWRYLASRKEELLEKPLGRKFEFKIFPSDAGMRTTFLAD